jgi:hypothetical protein
MPDWTVWITPMLHLLGRIQAQKLPDVPQGSQDGPGGGFIAA